MSRRLADAGPAVEPRRRRWLAAAAVFWRHRAGAAARFREPRGEPASSTSRCTIRGSTRSRISCSTRSSSWLSGGCSAGSSSAGRRGRRRPRDRAPAGRRRRDVPAVRGQPQLRDRRTGGERVRGPARYRPWTGAAVPADGSERGRRGRDRRHGPRRSFVPAPAARQPRPVVHAPGRSPEGPGGVSAGAPGRLDSPSFYNELAWIEVESGTGDARAAVGYAGRALAATPRSPDVLDTYAWALHHAGRSREALPFLERAFAGKPRMFCIHYHLGEVYAALGDDARAEFHLREQMRLFPRGSEARRAEQSLRRRGLL